MTLVSSFKEKLLGYTPPTNQGGDEKKEGTNDVSSYSKHKRKETQVSIIKEKHSRNTPPTNQGWEEKEEGSNDESSHSKHKI